MIRTGAALILVAVATLSTHAQLSPPTCTAPANVQAFDSLTALPTSLRAAPLKKHPDMVDRSRPFDSTDVVMYGARFHCFDFAWKTPQRFVVVTEQGGFTYRNPIYLYAISEHTTQPPPELQTPRFTHAADLCNAAVDALTAAPITQ